MSLYTKLRIAYLYNQIKDQDDTSLRSLIEANLSSESDYRLYSFKEIYAQFFQIIKESSSEYEIEDKIYSWTSKLPDSDELTRRILEYKEHLKKDRTDYSESAFCYYIKGFNEKIQSLSDICCEYVKHFSTEISNIPINHPNYTSFTLDVIQIVAPAIAQQYSGLPLMSVVAALTVMCRRGIMKYINGELRDI